MELLCYIFPSDFTLRFIFCSFSVFMFHLLILLFFENHKTVPRCGSGKSRARNFSSPKTVIHDNKVSLLTYTQEKIWDGFSWNNIGKYVIKMLHIYFHSEWRCYSVRECAPCRPILRVYIQEKKICSACIIMCSIKISSFMY